MPGRVALPGPLESTVPEALLPDTSPLLALALVLVAGVVAGGASKRLRLPSITGQIVIGVALGPSLFNVFGPEVVHGLAPITHFALGLMAVAVGAHLNLARMRNAGKRLGYLWIAEGVITPVLVFLGLYFVGNVALTPALLLATIAISTAPATVVAVVKETRSKGVFVKTLVGTVALNNITCIFLFEIARALAAFQLGADEVPEVGGLLLAAGAPLGQAALLGGALAVGVDLLNRYVVQPERLATAGAAAILITVGLAQALELSPLLACLFLGIVQTNLNPAREQLVDQVFANFEGAILAVFFTLAGLQLDPHHLGGAGLVALFYFVLRAGAKLASADIALRLAGATDRMRRNLGLALIPQAGLAIGLLFLLEEDPTFQANPEVLNLLVAVVLAAVTLAEVAGPILARVGLARSGEIDKDRTRLIDFLQEEHIITDLVATTKEEAIGKLTDVLIRSHHLKGVERDALLQSFLDREAEASTCFGGGLAVPHGILAEGDGMVGVMGLSRQGLAFETPDGRPVHCMVLLATPAAERQRHLQVLATLARVVGTDPAFQKELFNTDTPAHAYELLHGEESEDFNYYLGED